MLGTKMHYSCRFRKYVLVIVARESTRIIRRKIMSAIIFANVSRKKLRLSFVHVLFKRLANCFVKAATTKDLCSYFRLSHTSSLLICKTPTVLRIAFLSLQKILHCGQKLMKV
jgi:hypothetical protein